VGGTQKKIFCLELDKNSLPPARCSHLCCM
jgi:hypothetical protein